MPTNSDLRRGIYVGKSPNDFISRPWFPKDRQSDRIHSNYSVIKLNSTYVETVDDGYANRGFGAMVGIAFSSILAFMLLFIMDRKIVAYSFTMWIVMVFLLVGLLCVCLMIAKVECFAHTHYPIRYNRKNRCVYVWKPMGRIRKFVWDELCFFPGKRVSPITVQLVVGAALTADKKKIEDVFFVGVEGGDADQQKMFVEFYRRYMDQGPGAVVNEESFRCLPRLDVERESWWFGWKQLMLQDNGLPIAQLIWMPFLTVQSLFRFIAMRTSKIPVWPEWVEAECQVDADDPCVRDSSTNPPVPFITFAK